MSMKPAEWLLTHAAIVVVAGLVGLLLSSGGIVWTLVGLALGIVLPWIYLSYKHGAAHRRRSTPSWPTHSS